MNFCRNVILSLIPLLAGCTTGSSVEPTMASQVQACEEPRPQVCTMDYRPVCASLAEGGVKTYSNGCGACADVAVMSWVEGACPE